VTRRLVDLRAPRDPERFPHQGPLDDLPIFPGRGYPPNPGESRPGLSPFGRLAKGNPLGKSSVFVWSAAAERSQQGPVQLLQIEGDDLDASQLLVTLAPPRVIALPFADVQLDIDQQILTGEQGNGEVTAGDFPGTASRIAWPPLEAVLEWGVKGAQAKAVVDYVNGLTVSVVASYLRVYAQVSQTIDVGAFAGTSAAYYLAAFVGPGWTKTGTAQRTVYVGSVVNGDSSAVFDVPRFARKAIVVGCDTTNPPGVTVATLQFWQSPNGTNNVGNFLQSGNQPLAFDVPNAAQYFSVMNGMGNPVLFSVLFELSF